MHKSKLSNLFSFGSDGVSSKKRRRAIFALVAVAATAVALVGCAAGGDSDGGGTPGADSPSVETVRVVSTRGSAPFPIYVALENGYFEEVGLDVSIDFIKSPADIPAVLGQQYDIGLGVQTITLAAASKGIDVVGVLGGRVSRAGASSALLIASPESGIRTAQDLVGKRVGALSIGGTVDLATKNWLVQQGVDPKDVTFVQVASPNQPDQLAAGKIDAAEASDPVKSLLLEQGNVMVADVLPTIADPTPMANWTASGDWARSHLDVLAKFKEAAQKGIDFMNSNSDEAYAILAKFTGEDIESAKLTDLSLYTLDISENDYLPWLKAMQELNGFTGTVDMDKMVVTPK